MAQETVSERHNRCAAEREACTAKIVASNAPKIVVVAGPGTGKTTLFKEKIRSAGNNTLTLSFINALVDDLSLGLRGISDVRTLHGYAVGILRKTKPDAAIFAGLPEIIETDAAAFLGGRKNFSSYFYDADVPDDLLSFYRKRKDYYGSYYGFPDSIFALVRYFDQNPSKIPVYDQVLVDEFQDFNRVEVRLIDHLAVRSPVLIAGDDDQSLYSGLKQARPEIIRERYGAGEYEPHSLPYCSRSTEVIVGAVNDLVRNALKKGLLRDRIDKPFSYFACKEKDTESERHNRLIRIHQFDKQIPAFIRSEIANLTELEKKRFEVLVVVPPKRKARVEEIAATLRKKGLRRVMTPQQFLKSGALDALALLATDRKCNLGWRVALEALAPAPEFQEILKRTEDCKVPIVDLVTPEFKKSVLALLKTYKKVKESENCEAEALSQLFSAIGQDPIRQQETQLRLAIQDNDSGNDGASRSVREIPVTVTTVSGSKGLAADYVFITHFDDLCYSEKGTIRDEDIFSLLVALTRARRKVYLVSSQEAPPQIMSLIDTKRFT